MTSPGAVDAELQCLHLPPGVSVGQQCVCPQVEQKELLLHPSHKSQIRRILILMEAQPCPPLTGPCLHLICWLTKGHPEVKDDLVTHTQLSW